MERSNKGDIQIDGRWLSEIRDLSGYRSRAIGLVFQLHNLLTGLTALENVLIPIMEAHLSPGQQKEKARRLLELVALSERLNSRPPQLSGGERQRVAIVRALANDPAILLADEPTGSLDSVSEKEILNLLHQVRDTRGITILMITHDLDVAKTADRIIYLRDGRITTR